MRIEMNVIGDTHVSQKVRNAAEVVIGAGLLSICVTLEGLRPPLLCREHGAVVRARGQARRVRQARVDTAIWIPEVLKN
jgi:hypothetical protein